MNRRWNVFGLVCVAFLIFPAGAHGQVSFSQPPTYAGSGQLFVADFNGNSKLGILAANGSLNLGNGDGTFKAGTAVTGTPLAVADFNGDGKPDVLELGTGTLRVLLGNGDGAFQAPVITNSGAGLTVVAATDLNGDGKADVVGIFNNTLFVYLANGNGTFAQGVQYSLGAVQIYLPTILFGDFNGDHKTDIAVLTSPQEIVLLGNGDGTFQSTVLTSTGAATTASVVVGDFNGDGRVDLAATLTPTNGAVTVIVQFGNGDGTFQAATTAFSGPASNIGQLAPLTALAAADVNGDGKLDLVLAADLIGIYLGNGDGTFTNTPIYYQPVSSGNAGIAIADFNSDGKPDIAVDDEILLGNGNGKFQGPPTTLLPSLGVFAVGKFIKNGAPGVAMADGTSVCVLTNDGTGLLSLAHTYNLPQGGDAIATADVNGDGNLDLIITGFENATNWGYSVLLGNGDGTFQPPVWHPENVQGRALSIVIADFNNDHKLDLAVQAGNQTFAMLLGNGDGTFGAAAYVFDGDGGNFVSADFNGDGNLDIAEAGPSGLAIVLGNGDGTFKPAAFPGPTLKNTGIKRAVDVNGDGKVDLIFDGIQVLLGDGDGTFNALPVQNLGSGMNLFSDLYDFNGDGKLDVIATEAVLGISYDFRINGVFLGNGDGTFGPSPQIPIAYQSPVVQAIDVNGDGKADLLMQSNPYVAPTLFVVLNTTVTPALDFTVAPASGSPTLQTISAGQKATFSLSFAAVGGFSGSVSLTCSISPTVTPPPTCSLPSSVQIGSTAQTVTVTVATTAPVTTSTLPAIGFPPAGIPLAWTALVLGSGWLFLRNRKRLPGFAAPLIVLAFATWVGCGGGASSSHHTTPGTPAGTYTATVTATSGSISHSIPLTVVVK